MISGDGGMKAVNSQPSEIHGAAKDVKMRIDNWEGLVDFTIVSMDDYTVVLGMEFIYKAKVVPIAFAHCMIIRRRGWRLCGTAPPRRPFQHQDWFIRSPGTW